MPRSVWTTWVSIRLQAFRSRWPVFPARVLSAPRVLIDDADASHVRLRGVVCSVCAQRTRDALGSVPGVESVQVDLARSEAALTYADGVRPDEEALQRALDRVVLGLRIRRWIERVATIGWPWRRSR